MRMTLLKRWPNRKLPTKTPVVRTLALYHKGDPYFRLNKSLVPSFLLSEKVTFPTRPNDRQRNILNPKESNPKESTLCLTHTHVVDRLDECSEDPLNDPFLLVTLVLRVRRYFRKHSFFIYFIYF